MKLLEFKQETIGHTDHIEKGVYGNLASKVKFRGRVKRRPTPTGLPDCPHHIIQRGHITAKLFLPDWSPPGTARSRSAEKGKIVAVGMPVARHPPHRSRRAGLPHRAPASGQTQRRWLGYGWVIGPQVQDVLLVASPPLSWTTRLLASPFLLPLVPWPERSTMIAASTFRFRSPVQGFPWPRTFSPQTPPVVGHSLVVHLCSSASWILFPCPTSRLRTRRGYGFGLTLPDQARDYAGRFRDLPASGQRAC